MKINKLTLTLAALLSVTASAFSQANWGSTGAITVALTLSYTDEALMLKDETGKVLTAANGGGPTFENTFSVVTEAGPVGEKVPVKTVSTTEYASKITVAKWGNAEILKALVADGVIPQKGKAPFIAGWSIIQLFDAQGSPTSIVARHTDKTTVDITSLTITATEGTSVSAKTEKTVTTENTPLVGEPSSISVHTFAETFKGRGAAEVPAFAPDILSVTGLLTGSSKLVLKTEGVGIDKVVTEVIVPGAIKLDKVLGTSPMEDLIEGSISIAPGAVIDLNIFNPPAL